VQSLDRGLAVIRAFGADRPRLTLSEVAVHAGVSRAAARRLLLTLQAIGYVDSDDGRHFALRPAVLDLGFAYLASQPWWREAQRQIGPLATRLGHPVAVGVLDGVEVVYVAYAAPNPIANLDRSVGTMLPDRPESPCGPAFLQRPCQGPEPPHPRGPEHELRRAGQPGHREDEGRVGPRGERDRDVGRGLAACRIPVCREVE
jgi:DNA-binding IclR family transcriptional regulator